MAHASAPKDPNAPGKSAEDAKGAAPSSTGQAKPGRRKSAAEKATPDPNLPLDKQDDRALVAMVKTGNDRAFQELVQRYNRPVYFLILKIVQQDQDAEDLVQEAFTKAYASIKSFDPQYAFTTWFYRIATNAAIDFIRRQKLRRMISGSSSSAEETEQQMARVSASDPNPDEQVRRNQRHAITNQAIAGLPDRYRRLIELRYIQEWSYDEIAQHLQLPLGTVKAQLHRARELLSERLGPIKPSM